ncbi:MAG: class I SAM-dependent methyltransferase [Woeseiaceae bacterium]|nr:class I SAM-dependent methyltransferase [Woeseiaceae bacterium]
MTNRDLSADETKQEWGNYYSSLSGIEGNEVFKEEYANYVGTHTWNNTVRVVLEYSGIKDGQKILDAGCGWGRILLGVVDNISDLDITAFDQSEEATGIGQQLFKDIPNNNSVTWENGDIQELPFEDNSFDVVYSCRVFQHLNDPTKGVDEVCRVLKPGGRFVLLLQNALNPLNRNYYSRLYKPGEVRGWFANQTPASLSVNSMDFYPSGMPFPTSRDGRMAIERAFDRLPLLNKLGGKVLAVCQKS